MDNLDPQAGVSAQKEQSRREAWLKMLRSGDIIQCDKVASFMKGLPDGELKENSRKAFGEGLRAVGVAEQRAAEIVQHLFASR